MNSLQRGFVVACLILYGGEVVQGWGQRVTRSPRRPVARNIPFADPENFLDQLFGAESERERAALSRIEISVREESRAGSRAAETYLKNLRRQKVKIRTRGKDVEYLESLVELLRRQLRNADRYGRIRVYLADSPATDARSFPGGHLVFFRGLLEFAQSEAALVGVVGHELSHLDWGHQLLDLRRAKLAQQTFTTNASPQRFWQSGTLMRGMFTRPFRPEDELQADLDGITWAHRAGYDPREMAELFYRMHRRDGASRRARLPAFLRTHPYHLDRYRAAIELCERLQAREPRHRLYVGRENLTQRIPRSERVFPE